MIQEFGLIELLIFSSSSSCLFWNINVICGQWACETEAVNSAFLVATAFAPDSTGLFQLVYPFFPAEWGKEALMDHGF